MTTTTMLLMTKTTMMMIIIIVIMPLIADLVSLHFTACAYFIYNLWLHTLRWIALF